MSNLNQTSPRREWIGVAALTLVGAVLRFWGVGRLGLEHFDEGVYALAGLWPFSPQGLSGMGPDVIAYAPPGFPILVGLAYLVFGVADLSAIVVSIIAGVLTIPTAAWLGRRTFGPGAGVATAAFAALSGPHVAFSRMALTDALFLLAWLIALGLGTRFLERPRLGRALVFGLAVGLAQNVKYNGGLTGVIVALAAFLMMVKPEPGHRREVVRVLGYGLIAAAVSALVYLPWYRFVEGHDGGYAALMAHHRSYLSGVSQWLPHWRTQTAEQVALSGVLTWGLNWGAVAWPLAWLGCRLEVGEGPPSHWRGMRFRLGLLGGTLALGASASVPWWIALARSPALLVHGKPAGRVLAVGWIVMAALTPFYHPYARLWLPLHGFGWMIMGGLVAELLAGRTAVAANTAQSEAAPPALWRRVGAGGIALALAVLSSLALDQVVSPHPKPMAGLLSPTDSLRIATEQISQKYTHRANETHDPIDVVRVFARPPVLFYLSMNGVPVERVDGLESLFRPASPRVWALHDSAIDLATSRSDQPQEWRAGQWDIFGMFWDRPSPPTLLDLDPGLAFHPSHLEPPFQPGLLDLRPPPGFNPSTLKPPFQRLTLYDSQ
ncbi:MAG: glycosyltransferase family 39 protein [Isosphaeraceae bacterium]